MLKTSTCPAEKPRHPMMRGTAVSGGQQRRATWNTFAGIPWQVGGRKRHLKRFCRDSVAGGRQEKLPGTLSREFRGRWEAGRCYLERFCGETVAGGRQRRTPDTLSREYRARWTAKKDTWNAFAGIPWQVGSGKGHLTRFRGNSVPGGRRGDATWNAFAGKPWQVEGGKRHLERFRGNSVPGRQQEVLPDTLLRGYSATLPDGKFYWDMKLNLC